MCFKEMEKFLNYSQAVQFCAAHEANLPRFLPNEVITLHFKQLYYNGLTKSVWKETSEREVKLNVCQVVFFKYGFEMDIWITHCGRSFTFVCSKRGIECIKI